MIAEPLHLRTSLPMSALAGARNEFLAHRDAARALSSGAPPAIVDSWVRSSLAGVDPMSQHIDWEPTDPEHQLARHAHGPVERLVGVLHGLEAGVVLSEQRSRVLARYETARAATRALDAIDLAPGFDYSEGAVGTNGIGTAAATGRPVYVAGPGHFREQFGSYACAGAPIFHPLTRELVGVLDLSCGDQHASPLLLSLAVQTAALIREELLGAATAFERFALETYTGALARAGERTGVIVAAGDLRLQNTAAKQLLSSHEQRLLLRQGEEYSSLAEETEFSYEDTATGRVLSVTVRSWSAGASGTSGGILLTVRNELPVARVVDDAPAERNTSSDKVLERAAWVIDSAPFQSRAPAQRSFTRSSACRLARRELSAVLRRYEAAAVLGEVGTGKATLVREVIASTQQGALLLELDARPSDTDGELATELAAELAWHQQHRSTQRDSTERVFCMLTNVQHWTDRRLHEAASLLRTPRVAGTRIVFVITADSRSADSPELQALLPYVHYAVNMPPLRERRSDFALIAQHLVERLTGKRCALTEEALQALADGSWPGNISQLAEVLSIAAGAAAQRGDTRITRSDLPPRAYSAGRKALSQFERSERNTIAAALHRCSGNRSAAARYLGISRATLYRKLAAYGL